LPPGESSSAGMSRSTNASTVAAYVVVKYFQFPGVTGSGGSAEPGFHGSPLLIIAARAPLELSSNQTALVPRSCRRFI
jgi:hypothetical protein